MKKDKALFIDIEWALVDRLHGAHKLVEEHRCIDSQSFACLLVSFSNAEVTFEVVDVLQFEYNLPVFSEESSQIFDSHEVLIMVHF